MPTDVRRHEAVNKNDSSPDNFPSGAWLLQRAHVMLLQRNKHVYGRRIIDIRLPLCHRHASPTCQRHKAPKPIRGHICSPKIMLLRQESISSVQSAKGAVAQVGSRIVGSKRAAGRTASFTFRRSKFLQNGLDRLTIRLFDLLSSHWPRLRACPPPPPFAAFPGAFPMIRFMQIGQGHPPASNCRRRLLK